MTQLLHIKFAKQSLNQSTEHLNNLWCGRYKKKYQRWNGAEKTDVWNNCAFFVHDSVQSRKDLKRVFFLNEVNF